MAQIDMTGKTLEERMDIVRDQAKSYFRQGLNCTECVIKAYMDTHDTGLPEEVICMGTGFGGGIGGTKNICGAITGAVMAAGMAKGRRDPLGREDMKERIKELGGIYPCFKAMEEEIEGQYGTLICRELSDPFGDFGGKARKKNCMEMIGCCAAMAEKYSE